MYIILISIHFLLHTNGREQGPPPEDSGLFNEFEYYYDIYINESMIALPDIDPKYQIAQAVYISGSLKLSERELSEKMVNVTRINGGLSVTSTIFTNLSFLSSIEIIQIDAYKSQYLANIDIINNTNLLTLGMKAKRDGLYLTIRDNPKLCITSRDLDNLFYGLSLDSNLDIKLCFNNETSSYWCQLPDSGDLNVYLFGRYLQQPPFSGLARRMS
ncbi:hypothetical protein GCK72_023369 [Caenorhabditis remanei]|uniref:Receptor L-domain domain-containing protein n=1 Tax=Caenorhabditis remanei TaxID=31234 RepID=A0A6A5FWS9_CAERE|nr:hypothetical protein GCK72_023369 [Caenorhabditis remanei]KAF1746911.1 hypothetical protein GCK72_023369 [Caenorhabditis remanei]